MNSSNIESDQLQLLIDQQAIQNCIIKYCYYFDTNQPNQLVQIFTDDASIDYGPEVKALKGHPEILATVSHGLTHTFAATSHHVSNFMVEVTDSQSATLTCYLYAWHQYKETGNIGYLWGQYSLRLKRVRSQWKICDLVLRGTATQDFHRANMHSIGRMD
jgi:inosine/xanthosine triphosphate pyrophosphatase family protein